MNSDIEPAIKNMNDEDLSFDISQIFLHKRDFDKRDYQYNVDIIQLFIHGSYNEAKEKIYEWLDRWDRRETENPWRYGVNK